MMFYSGFSLKDEVSFFDIYLDRSDYSVSGFSYGAIKAFHEVERKLLNGERVDKMQLFSPAFFQTKALKFKKLQMMAYNKNKQKYMKQFLAGCFAPYKEESLSHEETTSQELEELLYYEWSLERLEQIGAQGVKVEVYLGGEDKIIDVDAAREFFLQSATVTYMKNANHFLQMDKESEDE